MRTTLQGTTIVLGVTGSIAAYKAGTLARLLVKEEARVRVVLTKAGARFVTAHTFAPLAGGRVYDEMFEEPPPSRPVHLDIPDGADAVLVAPASADFIGRLAAGLGDDLLASVCLAAVCPLLIAPAMHHQMWANRIVQHNVARLVSFGVRVVGPARGELAGRDQGQGRMSEPEDIVAALRTVIVGEQTA
ncbi:MAG: hypothetical protein MUE60_08360 [Candidatus Eisenbacteria bacterium]|jgi:phosphopantothenoylcysteine decarboxylase/phosphopantothenate--cysteine ligase|nr:hypothetical protein [Candidatus Eisenbacteria bacterium]